MKTKILVKFAIKHLQRPALKAEYHSQKERVRAYNEKTYGTDSTYDNLLGEEAISCLSSAHYANDIDSFINDLADRIVKREGVMWMRDPYKEDKSSKSRDSRDVDAIIDNLTVFNCPEGDQDSICEKLKKKCHEKINEKRDKKWEEQEKRSAEVTRRVEEAAGNNKKRKTGDNAV